MLPRAAAGREPPSPWRVETHMDWATHPVSPGSRNQVAGSVRYARGADILVRPVDNLKWGLVPDVPKLELAVHADRYYLDLAIGKPIRTHLAAPPFPPSPGAALEMLPSRHSESIRAPPNLISCQIEAGEATSRAVVARDASLLVHIPNNKRAVLAPGNHVSVVIVDLDVAYNALRAQQNGLYSVISAG
jgi:hypothetical protein